MSGSVDKTLRIAKAQAKSGAFAEAEALYREVLARFPSNKRAQAGLAELQAVRGQGPLGQPPRAMIEELVGLARARRFRDLVAATVPALARFPRAEPILELRAVGLLNIGDHRGAADLYKQLADMRPMDVELLGKLGNAQLMGGDAEGAVETFSRLLELRPGDAVAHNNLGNALANQREPERAMEHYAAAVAARPDLLPARVNLGKLLYLRGEVPEARRHIEAAVKLAPDNPNLLDLLGNLLKAQGDTEGAKAQFDAALTLAPKSAAIHLNRALVQKFQPGDPQIATLEALHRNPSTPVSDRSQFGFALAKAYEDLGEIERSYARLKQANAERKAEIGYDTAQSRKLFDQIRKAFPAPHAPIAPLEAPTGPEPIFILGLPRSGTTLIEQIISSHPDVVAGGEREELNSALKALDWSSVAGFEREGAKIEASYREMLRRFGGEAGFVTDKMPSNFLWIGAIRALFPKARIVHVQRDPRAVLWSIYKMRFTGTGYGFGYDLGDLVAYHGLYRELMAHWRALFGDAVIDVDYEALTADPEPAIRALTSALGLPWNDACLRPQDNTRAVNTASNLQVRRAIYTGSSQDWQRYAHLIGEAFAGLPE